MRSLPGIKINVLDEISKEMGSVTLVADKLLKQNLSLRKLCCCCCCFCFRRAVVVLLFSPSSLLLLWLLLLLLLLFMVVVLVMTVVVVMLFFPLIHSLPPNAKSVVE